MVYSFKVGKYVTPIGDCVIAAIPDRTYTGKAHKPAPVVTYGGTLLAAGTDYTVSYKNNVNAGTATATITGIGKFAGSVSKSFTIKPRDLSECKIAKLSSAVYTGAAIKPVPTVKYSGVKLVKGTDFTIGYKKNKAVGVATVTIKGKGNFSGSVKKTFTIKPKAVALSSLTAGKKKLTAKWKKGAGISGYQLEYGRKKDFSDGKKILVGKSLVKKTIKSLKSGKTYYVRIRAYKKVSGKTYYSAWSKALKKKVK